MADRLGEIMTEKFQIAVATVNDAEQIIELIKKEFPYYNLSKEELHFKMESGKFTMFKATKQKELAGFVEIEFLNETKARINGITVKEKFRGQNAAKSLLAKSISFLKEQGTEKVSLLVKESNEKAKQLYKKMGFNFSGMYPKTIENEKVEEMVLPLEEQDFSFAA